MTEQEYYISASVVGLWLGVGRQQIHKYRERYDDTPIPDVYVGREARWNYTRKQEWIDWEKARKEAVQEVDRKKFGLELQAKYLAGANLRMLANEYGWSLGYIRKLLIEVNTPMRRQGTRRVM